MILRLKLLLGVLSIVLLSCSSNEKMELQTGDMLFCGYQAGELSKAIDEVTQTKKSTHYSHNALVEIIEQDTFVIHASIKRGVVKETLQKFLQIDQPLVVDAYRLVDSLTHLIPEALKHANKLIGLPYNKHYQMNDTSYYCSQLFYEIYKEYKVFELEPMTFKNPVTHKFNKGWVNYYKNLGMEIPEGEPGCNPNGLAASKNIVLIHSLK